MKMLAVLFGFALRLATIKHVFVWVPPLPDVLNKFSGIPTIASISAFVYQL
jgi:hypothetical protein